METKSKPLWKRKSFWVPLTALALICALLVAWHLSAGRFPKHVQCDWPPRGLADPPGGCELMAKRTGYYCEIPGDMPVRVDDPRKADVARYVCAEGHVSFVYYHIGGRRSPFDRLFDIFR